MAEQLRGGTVEAREGTFVPSVHGCGSEAHGVGQARGGGGARVVCAAAQSRRGPWDVRRARRLAARARKMEEGARPRAARGLSGALRGRAQAARGGLTHSVWARARSGCGARRRRVRASGWRVHADCSASVALNDSRVSSPDAACLGGREPWRCERNEVPACCACVPTIESSVWRCSPRVRARH
jgi:hypothetical protein